MPLADLPNIWGALSAIGLAVLGFFSWLIRKMWALEARLNKDYPQRDEMYEFVQRVLGPVNRRLDVLHDDVQSGFRQVNKRLDQKVDRRNGTG